MAEQGRLSTWLAPMLLVCACATGTSDGDGGPADAATGQPDSSAPPIDAPAGTPDASVPHPDAYIPPTPDASGGGTPITITQSDSDTITTLNSVACFDTLLGNYENSYYRVFDLAAEGITSQFDVTSVEIAIEDAISGTGGQQPATVYLHTLSGVVAVANLDEIGSAAVSVSDQSLDTITVNVTGTVPAGGKLVVEFYVPDAAAAGHILFVGSNDLGESGPTYLRASDCAADDMTTTTALGFPEMQWVMSVNGLHYP